MNIYNTNVCLFYNYVSIRSTKLNNIFDFKFHISETFYLLKFVAQTVWNNRLDATLRSARERIHSDLTYSLYVRLAFR